MSHPSWIEFLSLQGLPQDPASRAAAATEPGNEAPMLIALTQQSLISLEGPDAEKFLQGQLTCDLGQLSPERSLLGANCTHKGMVISVARLFKRAQGSLLMRLPLAVAEPALANLKKFAVFSKVEINPVNETWVGLGLMGESAPEQLSQIGITPPTNTDQQTRVGDLIVVRVLGTQPRFELWSPLAQAQSLWQQLAAHSQLGNNQDWLAADIEAGLVQLDPDSLDSYIPQMLNLQAVDGIAFSKGCYTGQEVVARLQFRGKLKKLMYAATVNIDSLAGQTVCPGAQLFTGTGRSVGKVLNCVQQGEQLLLQAIIGKAAADANELHLLSAEGAAVSVQPLPYSIDSELFERPER